MLRLSRFTAPVLFVTMNSVLTPVAMAEGEAVAAPATPGAPAAETVTVTENTAAATPPATQTFVADGGVVALDHLGIKITPPQSWEVVTNGGTLSVLMREPKDPNPDYVNAKYQRNITVATIHRASPVDEARAAGLKEELKANFSADPLVSNFQVLEHKFFNYRGNNDGLLVYSSLNIGEFALMQAHVLVSGAEKQFLMTYTDLADRFSDEKSGGFSTAWTAMVSLEVVGIAPNRYDEYIRWGAGATGCLLLFGTLWLLRRRRGNIDYAAEADSLMDSGEAASTSIFATLAHGWRLDGHGEGEAVEGLEFSRVNRLDEEKAVTRETAAVSTF